MPTRVFINGNWYRVAEKNGVPLYQPKNIPFLPPQVSQSDITDVQFDPLRRGSLTVRDLSGGYGQAEMPLLGENTRYDHVGDAAWEGVDASLTPDGPILLGPKAVNVSDSISKPNQQLLGMLSTGGFIYFTLNNDGGTARQFWRFSDTGLGAGTYSLRSETLPISGGGNPIIFRGTQSQDYWYIVSWTAGALGTPHYSTDSGSTWTAITTTGGIQFVRAMTVVDEEMVVAMSTSASGKSTMIRRFQDGGVSPTAFGTIDPIGDAAYDITQLVTWDSRVVIVKQREGVFLLSADRISLAVNLFPEIPGSGYTIEHVMVWRGILWVCATHGVFAVSRDLNVQEIEIPASTGSPFLGGRGQVTSLVGDAHHLYGTLIDSSSDTKAGWLLKAVVTITNGRVSAISWHQVLALGAVRAVVTDPEVFLGASFTDYTANPNLWISVQDAGTNAYLLRRIRLSSEGADPRSDQYYQYALGGTIYLSRAQARLTAVNKQWLSLTPRCADLGRKDDGITGTSANLLTPRYKLDTTPLTAASPYGYTEGTQQGQSDATGSPQNLTDMRGKGIDVAWRLATVDATTSPQMYASALSYLLQPQSVWEHDVTLDLSSGSVADDGANGYGDPVTPDAAYRILRTLPGSAAATFRDIWGNEFTCAVPPGGVQPVISGQPEAGYGEISVPLLIRVQLVETLPAVEAIR